MGLRFNLNGYFKRAFERVHGIVVSVKLLQIRVLKVFKAVLFSQIILHINLQGFFGNYQSRTYSDLDV